MKVSFQQTRRKPSSELIGPGFGSHVSLRKIAINDLSLRVGNDGNVTKDRLGPCQGSNERKVTGAGVGSGCGVQRRRRRLAIVCLPIRVQCRFGLETLGRKPVDANDMQQNQTSKSLL